MRAQLRYRKDRKTWQLRWQDSSGKTRTRTAPTEEVGRSWLEDCKLALAREGRWGGPPAVREEASTQVLMKAWLGFVHRGKKPATVKRYANSLALFARWLESRVPGPCYPEVLCESLLLDFYDHLKREKSREVSTLRKHLETVCNWWDWTARRKEVVVDSVTWRVQVPLPIPVGDLGLPSPVRKRVRAPSWEQMDQVILACTSEHFRRQAVLLRCTGLRIQQVMGLKWEHLSLEDQTLRVVVGKGNREAGGRCIPIAPVLAEELGTWECEGEYLVPTYREKSEDRSARVARARDMGRAWDRTCIEREVWSRRPHHAFRKGFVSGLKQLGADEEAVETLVGHSLSLRGRYLDPRYLPIKDAVARVPSLPTRKQSSDVVPIRRSA